VSWKKIFRQIRTREQMKEKENKKSIILWVMLATLLVLAVLFLSGCTTTYRITTDPSGAKVIVDGELVSVTPCTFFLSNPVDAMMVIKKEGYEEIREFLITEDTFADVSVNRHFILEEIPPVTFIQILELSWVSIEIREDIEYDRAWASVVDLIVRKFEAEILSKEDGYLRTTWFYTWTGELREDYRVRVTIKFSPDRTKVDIKSEANYLRGKNWIIGSDTALLQTLKADIMGIVGRVTR